MDVRCERCNAQYAVDDGLVHDAGLAVRCAMCGHSFKVMKSQGWSLRKTTGDVYPLPDSATLQRWVVEGRVTRDDEIAEPGRAWVKAGSFKDLEPFFTVMDQARRARSTAQGTPLPGHDSPRDARRETGELVLGDPTPRTGDAWEGPKSSRIQANEPAWATGTGRAGVEAPREKMPVAPREETVEPKSRGWPALLLLFVVLVVLGLAAGATIFMFKPEWIPSEFSHLIKTWTAADNPPAPIIPAPDRSRTAPTASPKEAPPPSPPPTPPPPAAPPQSAAAPSPDAASPSSGAPPSAAAAPVPPGNGSGSAAPKPEGTGAPAASAEPSPPPAVAPAEPAKPPAETVKPPAEPAPAPVEKAKPAPPRDEPTEAAPRVRVAKKGMDRTLDAAARSRTLLAQARSLRDRGRPGDALDVYARAIQANPNDAEALAGRGLAYLDLSRYRQAEESFKGALAVNASHPAALMGLAETYRYEGKRSDAVTYYRQYLAAHPKGEDATAARKAIQSLEESP